MLELHISYIRTPIQMNMSILAFLVPLLVGYISFYIKDFPNSSRSTLYAALTILIISIALNMWMNSNLAKFKNKTEVIQYRQNDYFIPLTGYIMASIVCSFVLLGIFISQNNYYSKWRSVPIGWTEQELENKIGKPDSTANGILYYKEDNRVYQLILKNGNVQSINILEK